MTNTEVSGTNSSMAILRNVLQCQVNYNEQCFLFVKIAISLRSEYNGLGPEYNLPMSVGLVNTA